MPQTNTPLAKQLFHTQVIRNNCMLEQSLPWAMRNRTEPNASISTQEQGQGPRHPHVILMKQQWIMQMPAHTHTHTHPHFIFTASATALLTALLCRSFYHAPHFCAPTYRLTHFPFCPLPRKTAQNVYRRVHTLAIINWYLNGPI